MDVRRIGIERLCLSRFRPAGFVAKPTASLIASLRETGFHDPMSVVPGSEGKYEIITGPEVWVAAGLAALYEVLIIVREDLSDEDVEAVVRDSYGVAKTNPIHEAETFDAQRHEYGKPGAPIPIAKLARLTGHSRSYVAHSLRLLRLPTGVQDMLLDGSLTPGQARPLLRLKSTREILSLAKRIIRDGLSARAIESAVSGKGSEPRPRAVRSKSDGQSEPEEKSADVLKLEREVSSAVGAEVSIDSSQLTIQYHGNYEILDGILERLGYKPSF